MAEAALSAELRRDERLAHDVHQRRLARLPLLGKKLRDDLRKELRGHAATGVFLFLLFAATVVLSVSAMRKLSKRVVTESTDIFDHEV